MRRSEPPPLSIAARKKRLSHLVAAFAGFRRKNPPGRRIPRELQVQVVAALNAGVTKSAIARTCGLSWAQVNRWRAAVTGDAPSSPPASAPVMVSPRVLSVVDANVRQPVAQGTDVEVRIGPWRLSISRTVD